MSPSKSTPASPTSRRTTPPSAGTRPARRSRRPGSTTRRCTRCRTEWAGPTAYTATAAAGRSRRTRSRSSNYLVDVVFEGEAVEPDAVVDDTTADFAAGVTGAATYVSDTAGDGEVVLAPTLSAEFEGTALPAGWTSTLWAGGGPGGSTVGGGAVVVDGALLATDATYGPGRSIEFDATFGAATFQHAGFGVDVNNVNRWAMFSTNNTTDTVFARTNNGGVESLDPIPGALVGSSHRYRIDWLSNAVVFSVDGVPRAHGAGCHCRRHAPDRERLHREWARPSHGLDADDAVRGFGDVPVAGVGCGCAGRVADVGGDRHDPCRYRGRLRGPHW